MDGKKIEYKLNGFEIVSINEEYEICQHEDCCGEYHIFLTKPDMLALKNAIDEILKKDENNESR